MVGTVFPLTIPSAGTPTKRDNDRKAPVKDFSLFSRQRIQKSKPSEAYATALGFLTDAPFGISGLINAENN
ncbi:MAG: hypothetical protein SPJ23_01015 [Eubacteriales bacterium]|nr:hypothetical protein [Eubacteriales bacterium]